MVGIMGCMPRTEDYYKREMDKAIEYLEEKYGAHFIATGYERADYLSTTDTVFCYEENMNPEEEKVQVLIQRENGEVKYSDNYFGYIIRPEVEQWVSEIVKTEFEDVKVYMYNDLGVLPDTLTKECNLEDLYQLKPRYLISTYIYVEGDKNIPTKEYEKKTQALEKQFKQIGKSFWLRIYVIDKGVFEKIDRYSRDEFYDLFQKLPEVDGENCFHIYGKQILAEE